MTINLRGSDDSNFENTVFSDSFQTNNFATANTGTGCNLTNDGFTSRTNAGFATYQVQNASDNHTRTFWIGGDGNVNIVAGGSGVVFPTNNAGSTNPNCLDDYEEGTWVPRCANPGVGAYDLQQGAYIKIGSVVHVWGLLRPTDLTGFSSDDLQAIRGLPFSAVTINNGNNTVGSVGWYDGSATASTNTPSLHIGNTEANVMFIQLKIAASDRLDQVNDFWTANRRASFSATYRTNQ